MTKISDNLLLSEVTRNNTASKFGIDNTPTPEHLENLKQVANLIFEPLRKGLGNKPIYVSCGYRGAAVNAKTKGASKTSYHVTGHALDLDAHVFGGVTNAKIFHYIKNNLDYAELIWEYGTSTEPDWVHVAYVDGKNVKETLIAYSQNGKPKYKNYENT